MAFLLRCRYAAVLSPPLAPRQRHFVARFASPAALGLKPLSAITTRSIGSSRPGLVAAAAAATATTPQEGGGESRSQFPRPSAVGYDKNLADSIHLIGCVVVTPDIKYLDTGAIVATSSLTVKKSPQGDPSWFFLEFQNDLAEIAAQHVRKGDRIHVGGRVLVENAADLGEKPQSIVKVEVSELHFVDDVYGSQAQPLSRPRSTGISDKKLAAEKLWKLFLENPSEWYDNRDNKKNPRGPDFKHKSTGEALWIDGYHTPSFVADQIADLEAKGVIKTSKPATAAPTTSSITEESTGGYSPW